MICPKCNKDTYKAHKKYEMMLVRWRFMSDVGFRAARELIRRGVYELVYSKKHLLWEWMAIRRKDKESKVYGGSCTSCDYYWYDENND